MSNGLLRFALSVHVYSFSKTIGSHFKASIRRIINLTTFLKAQADENNGGLHVDNWMIDANTQKYHNVHHMTISEFFYY